ncbi:hypothetical protein [Scytonema sp. NUACC26]
MPGTSIFQETVEYEPEYQWEKGFLKVRLEITYEWMDVVLGDENRSKTR